MSYNKDNIHHATHKWKIVLWAHPRVDIIAQHDSGDDLEGGKHLKKVS